MPLNERREISQLITYEHPVMSLDGYVIRESKKSALLDNHPWVGLTSRIAQSGLVGSVMVMVTVNFWAGVGGIFLMFGVKTVGEQITRRQLASSPTSAFA